MLPLEVPSEAPDRSRTAVIGVLGGIASGKSEVARQLAGERGVVIDADALARAELGSPRVVAELRARFGPEVLGPDGLPDRVKLAERVFKDPEARRALEEWIHPAVRARIAADLSAARAEGRSPIVLDVPLLLENDGQHGLVKECDFLVFVDADPGLRDRRATERRGWPSGEVARRESAQLPLAEKRARAKHVISNEAGLGELTARVQELLQAEGL